MSEQSNKEQKAKIVIQFELAKKIYAFHFLLLTAPGLNRQKLILSLSRAVDKFVTEGGVAKTGVGPLGDSGPLLFLEDGQEVSYDIGRLLADKYIDSGAFQ